MKVEKCIQTRPTPFWEEYPKPPTSIGSSIDILKLSIRQVEGLDIN
jgi:hypothetical protein